MTEGDTNIGSEDNLGFGKPEKLINVDYSYENIVKNPILKSIAETDRTVIDLREMAYKKAIDAARDKKQINEDIQSVPAYQSSNFIGRLINRNKEVDDLVKIQNLMIKNYVGCIREMYKDIMGLYGVYKEEKKENKKIDYRGYLDGLLKNEDLNQLVQLILHEYDKNKSTINDKRKFEEACGNIYTKQEEKEKIIIAKIMRMEY